jgi:hypothetical protein
VQLLAIDNLRRLGPEAAVALPELEKMKGDSDPRVQKAARDAIDAIRPKAPRKNNLSNYLRGRMM